MRTLLPLSVVLGIATSLAACGAGGDAVADQELSRKTTSPELAVANLSSQVAATQRRVEAFPGDISAREKLVDLLLARTQFLGSFDDFDAAFTVVQGAIDLGLAPARTAHLEAQLLSSVHRFDQALEALDRAEQLGAASTSALRETIALARGEASDSILVERAERATATPSYTSLTKLAAALSSENRFPEADAAYREALLSYRDVSPFPLAWVAFQRGLLWGERADDPERALELYRAAVARLPQYVVGNVHLAELEVEGGDPDRAIERLERIVDATQDPEPASRLAQFLAESDPERAAAYAERAERGYEHYLSKYPLAFADHATEFYLGAGNDPQRALELALLNLSNRKTERAYGLAIDAAIAAGHEDLARDLTESR